ncbi:CobW family GTP-binding protein [Chelatococcus sp. GCM10030263]|uniref:CobW family GTP-binding protein n=1 Tax=Chelatococcus sp. GCM10030263 TaxID=3273387 RepID=UPI003611AB29
MERRPVTVVTGFLGSGKTTLLNRLLADPQLADTAVVINEFGEIALDHLLVEQAIENAVVLQSGCICCTIRGDLVDTLLDLHERARRGELPAFSRVIVETTGLAEPGPIVQTLVSDGALTPLYRLNAVVATVDAVNGAMQLTRYAEASRQAAIASLILVTKSDIADPATVGTLRGELAAVNPTAEIAVADHGAVDPGLILAGATWDLAPEDLDRFLPSAAFAGAVGGTGPVALLSHAGSGHRPLRYGESAAVAACCLVIDRPMSWAALSSWLAAVISLRGADILRVKGIVHLEGSPGPTVIHGVQHLVHPPRHLAAWPDEDRRSRIVVIGRNISAVGLRRSLETALGADRQWAA